MKRSIFLYILFLLPLTHIFGQQERKLVREGVKEFQDQKYNEAEVQFRKALDAKPGLYEGEYDIANSLYKQKKYSEAASEYEKLLEKNNDPQKRADLYHNLGNSQVMAQQFDKGAEAYKNSLRIRPNDEDTRYNLAYALEKLKQQQQQQKDNKDNKKDDKDKQKQDQKDNKDNQDKKDDQQKDKDQQQQPNQDDKNKQDQKEGKDKQQQNISQQDAEQMLNAVQNQEKETKEKLDKKKAVAKPVRTEKDW